MGGKPHKLKWLEQYDGDMAASHAEGLAQGHAQGLSTGLSKGGDIRDQERITDMLRRGKTVEEIVDFCGYSYDQVKQVEDSFLADPVN